MYYVVMPKWGGQEVYYKEPDISGGIEGIDYIIEYGVNSEDNDK
jgi:hypothetical protein